MFWFATEFNVVEELNCKYNKTPLNNRSGFIQGEIGSQPNITTMLGGREEWD